MKSTIKYIPRVWVFAQIKAVEVIADKLGASEFTAGDGMAFIEFPWKPEDDDMTKLHSVNGASASITDFGYGTGYTTVAVTLNT